MEFTNAWGKKVGRLGFCLGAAGDPGTLLKTVGAGLDAGMNWIDLGGSAAAELAVGQSLSSSARGQVILSTMGGALWKGRGGQCERNVFSVREQLHDSLRRLRTHYLDVFLIPVDGTLNLEALQEEVRQWKTQGLVRQVGLCWLPTPANAFPQLPDSPLWKVFQFPYNFVERHWEDLDLPPHAFTVGYSKLGRGFLPTHAAVALEDFGRCHLGKSVSELALRWALDQGPDVLLVGARTPDELRSVVGACGWKLGYQAKERILEILSPAQLNLASKSLTGEARLH